MQPYYVQLLILVALRREHRLVVWKHPPSCSELTGSNVLVQHLLEDPHVPHSSKADILGSTTLLQVTNLSFSARGIFGHTTWVDLAL
jgi:hypothetical protein